MFIKFRNLILLFGFLAFNANAKIETIDSKIVSDKFVKYYNANQPDSIYALFNPEAKIGFPLEKTKAFLAQLHNNLGNILQLYLESSKNGANMYRAKFVRGLITLNLSTTGQSISAIFAKPYDGSLGTAVARNKAKMSLPFKGEWDVFWGGDTKEANYHVAVNFQRNAFDILIISPEGKSYKTNGKFNEDYYAFGQPLYAPSDGEVVLAVNGVKDNQPGEVNPLFATGNSVLIKTNNDEFVLLAHFKQNSIKVKQGDRVKRGELLGLCGNSGNSSEPHLHFDIQDDENFSRALGIKCYFDELKVNGEVKKDYSPVKGDKIKSIK
jgi:murein DD-endopeptidase MepM/ murein hydrolase activator NlpD